MEAIRLKDELINSANRDIHVAKLRIKALRMHAPYIRRLHAAMLKASKQDLSVTFNAYSYSYGPAAHEVVIKIDIDKLDGFKDARLFALLARIEKATEIEYSYTRDISGYENNPLRMFTHCASRYDINGENPLRFNIDISANVKSDAPTCKRVQVGVKTYTEPVYETHCE